MANCIELDHFTSDICCEWNKKEHTISPARIKTQIEGNDVLII